MRLTRCRRMSAADSGPGLFDQCRTVSRQMSVLSANSAQLRRYRNYLLAPDPIYLRLEAMARP